jgi:hypothetical protein
MFGSYFQVGYVVVNDEDAAPTAGTGDDTSICSPHLFFPQSQYYPTELVIND